MKSCINLKKAKLKGVNLFCANLENDWKTFKKNLKWFHAAGGLVLNQIKKSFLFID